MENLKELEKILRNIDLSLQVIANKNADKCTTAFVDKKTIANKLNVPLVTIDKLIHQGLVSAGKSGLVFGRHYTKIDPSETNTGNFLYDAVKILQDAWCCFKDYDNDQQR
jgi:hypothetical protein